MSYSADTLKQTSVLNLVPNGDDGGIWMAGAGPAADASGSVYFIIGNGDFDTTLTSTGLPSKGDCGNCFVKLAPAPKMALLDYFTPLNTVSESNADIDFGSGGPLLLPDLKDSAGATHHLAVGIGKDQNIYVVDRDNMGKFDLSKNAIYQQISGILPDAYDSSPIYFNNTVYLGGVVNPIMAFPITNAKLMTAPSSQTPAHYRVGGGKCDKWRFARVRCDESWDGTLQLDAGGEWARHLRAEQVHDSDGDERQGLRGHAEQRSGVWTAALSATVLALLSQNLSP
jgi:hypothetical protein